MCAALAAGGVATEPLRQPYGLMSACSDDQDARFDEPGFRGGVGAGRHVAEQAQSCHQQRAGAGGADQLPQRVELQAIEDGKLKPHAIISHRLPLEQAAEGYRMFDKKEDDCRKVVLVP